MTRISNFGRNIEYTPAEFVAITDEGQVLELLARAHGRKLRVVSRGHSWSEIINADDIAVDMQRMYRIAVDNNPHAPQVTVEAGCTLQRLVEVLDQHGLTLPTLGSVMLQTMAGALATGTHGSGWQSLSHCIVAMRIATYDPNTGEPVIALFDQRDPKALRAARCNLGAMGVVISLTLECRRQHLLQERVTIKSRLTDVLRERAEWPLQQFGFIPYCWKYLVYDRQETRDLGSRFKALRYRYYKLVVVDYLLHLLAKGILSRSWAAGFTRFFFKRALPVIAKKGTFRDRSDHILTLRHDFFSHVEMEVFVPEADLGKALDLTRQVIEAGAFSEVHPQLLKHAKRTAGAEELLARIKGRFTFHYVVFCRRVLADDTLISMTSGGTDYYSLSFFTFYRADEHYLAFCELVALLMSHLFKARLHWGKLFPLPPALMHAQYNGRVDQFARLCRRYDPGGVFRNPFIERLLNRKN